MASYSTSLTDEQLARVAKKRILFGHQSVGQNILDGLRQLETKDPRLKLQIVPIEQAASISGPALIEFRVGANGNPASKDIAFAAALGNDAGNHANVAMYKYCYVDIKSSTDVQRLFAGYRANITALKAEYPGITFVHITMPLTTVEPALKAFVKGALGRSTARELDIKRNEFNDLLRQTYSGIDPIFDLAAAEATRSDGTSSYFTVKGQRVYTLATEYTTDGEHLNESGKRAAGEKFLATLASF